MAPVSVICNTCTVDLAHEHTNLYRVLYLHTYIHNLFIHESVKVYTVCVYPETYLLIEEVYVLVLNHRFSANTD